MRGLLAAAVLGAAGLAAQEPPRPLPNGRRPSALKPVVCETPGEALEKAGPLGRGVLVAVGMAGESPLPPLFEAPEIARASRIAVALASVDFASEDDFFKGRAIRDDQVPGVLVLDAAGNLHEIHPPSVAPRILLASARNASRVSEARAAELARVAERAARGDDEKAVLDEVRPWLSRHYRGYPALARLHEIVGRFGRARLEAIPREDPAAAIETLEALSREYEHTPVEAAARVEIARLHDLAGRRDASRSACRAVLDRLPWPENAESHAKAREMLARFRKDEIRRRLGELEKKP